MQNGSKLFAKLYTFKRFEKYEVCRRYIARYAITRTIPRIKHKRLVWKKNKIIKTALPVDKQKISFTFRAELGY